MQIKNTVDYSVGKLDDSYWNKLNNIISQSNMDLKKSDVVNPDAISSTRVSENSWILDSELKEMFLDLIMGVNFNLTKWDYNINNIEDIQYTIYKKGYHYDWHKDTFPVSDLNTRKISASVFLNDPNEYEGGELDIEIRGPNSQCRYDSFKLDKKSIVVFKSNLWHRVRPVISGVRKSLVLWFIGPPFI